MTHDRKHLFDKLFLAVSSFATAFVLLEILLQSFNMSLCPTEGCKTTDQYARFGGMSILLIGFGMFFSITGITILNRRARRPTIDRLINLLLIVALTGEGFFMGYLAFRIHVLCIFCATVFGFMATLGILRALSGEKDVLAGFATCAAIFSIQYLILPAGVTVNLPPMDRLVLFYSRDCKHCAEVLKEIDEKKVSLLQLPVSEYGGFLKNVGIDTVPTLMVNDQYQKVFLTGQDAITRYLLSCTEAKKTADRAVPPKKADKTVAAPSKGSGMTIDIFNQPGLLTAPSLSATDNGTCKQDEICK